MPAAKLRIAVAGLGRIGWRFHAQTLAKHRDYKLVAAADAEAERCDEARAAFGCDAYLDYYDMLDKTKLDAVVIATPTHLHKDMALAAFRNGLHVLMEKPLAVDLGEARTIVRAATRAGVVLTTYQPHRASAGHQHLRRIIDSGKIGHVYWVRRGMFSYARRNDWQSLRKFGGGMLSNYGAHALDQVLNLIGYDIKRVFGDLQLSASLGDADDVVKVVVETRSGDIGEAEINQASAISPYETLAWGTCGAIAAGRGRFDLRYFDPKELPAKEVNAHLASADRQYPSDTIDFAEETIEVDGKYAVDVFRDFANAVRKGTPTLVQPQEVLSVMKVMEMARESSGRIRDLRREA